MAVPIKEFIIERLLEFDSSFDTGAGVPTTSLLIEPLSIILQPVIDELTVVQASSSILTILESSDPNSFPEDIVDGLASNAFVERNPGQVGSDVMRIRFFEPQSFEAQQGVLIFRGGGGQRFTNSESFLVTESEMSLNKEGSLYFADIPVVSLEEGSNFNIAAGGITSMEAEPTGVANVTNVFGIQDGLDRETNTELIDRIKVAVTVRALVTGRGIIVTLTENFTTIEEITPVGFGDPEMMRDIVYNVHIGGNVDVYIKTSNFTSGSKDIFGLEVDVSRQSNGYGTVVLLAENIPYSLGQASVDRSNFSPSVRAIDGIASYDEGLSEDYVINDEGGFIVRVPGSGIFHEEDSTGIVTDTKTLSQIGAFTDVRRGMILTVSTPASVSGTYTVKDVPDADTVVIYSEFSVASAVGVNWQIDDNLTVSYEYNPVSVDVVETPRSSDREVFTVTDVPMMYVESIEVLDPLSGEPTGELLSSLAGFGAGPFGIGGFGIGSGADYRLLVEDPTLRHSANENNYIEFEAGFVGYSLRINYLHASAIPPIQAFMDDRNNQSMTASLLARHHIPIYVDSQKAIGYDIRAADETTSVSTDEMVILIENLVNDIDQNSDLETSDLIDLMYDNGAVRVDISSMQSLRGEIHNHDGSIGYTLPNDAGSMIIPSGDIADPTDRPLSPRIARFRSRAISVTRSVV